MRYVSKFASFVGGSAIAVLVCLTAYSVFARYVLGVPLTFTEEASGLLMIWIVMMAAISCEARNQHLSIDMLTYLLPDNVRLRLMQFVSVLSIGTLAVLGWKAYQLSMMTQFKKTQILQDEG